jgi:hypothetical protein
LSVAHTWGATPEERTRFYPCDALATPGDSVELFRAVDVAAPVDVTFRRLCHIRVAPYSYDWIDNGGRRSPRELVPGVENLQKGQRFTGIFELESYERDEHITLRLASPSARKLFGDITVTYAVLATSPATCRLVAKLRCRAATRTSERIRFALLAWGDLVMMRKQLLTLASLAQADAARETSSAVR